MYSRGCTVIVIFWQSSINLYHTELEFGTQKLREPMTSLFTFAVENGFTQHVKSCDYYYSNWNFSLSSIGKSNKTWLHAHKCFEHTC